MKKYVMLFAFTLAVLSWLAVIPCIMAISITKVKAAKVDYSIIQTTVECDGQVQAEQQETISYGYSIKPSKVYVKVGDTVNAGQKLMDIDYKQTQAAFKALSGVQSGSASNSSVSQTASGNSNLPDPAASTQSFTENSSMSNSDINSVISQFYGTTDTSAINSVLNAAASADSSITGSSSTTGESLSDLPDCVYSAVSGIVTQVNVKEGSFTTPGSTSLVVANLNSLEVKAQVNENQISKVKTGQSAIINGNSLSKKYLGKVKQIYPTAYGISTSSGNKKVVDVIIDLLQPDDSIKSGIDVNIGITTSDNIKSITVPYEAVNEDESNQEFVYTIKDGKAYRKVVKTGEDYDNKVQIISGLCSGDIVITNPPSNLKNNQYVKAKMVKL